MLVSTIINYLLELFVELYTKLNSMTSFNFDVCFLNVIGD